LKHFLFFWGFQVFFTICRRGFGVPSHLFEKLIFMI
jgi:hypothetical protein